VTTERRIEGRFLLVGYDGLPRAGWARVLFYRRDGGEFRPAEEVELDVPRGRVVTELLIFDPLTGRRWRVPATGRRP
jgi:hypothetical protein